jgi:hypothetical protein
MPARLSIGSIDKCDADCLQLMPKAIALRIPLLLTSLLPLLHQRCNPVHINL